MNAKYHYGKIDQSLIKLKIVFNHRKIFTAALNPHHP